MPNDKNEVLKSSDKKRGALYRKDTEHVESQDDLAKVAHEEEE